MTVYAVWGSRYFFREIREAHAAAVAKLTEELLQARRKAFRFRLSAMLRIGALERDKAPKATVEQRIDALMHTTEARLRADVEAMKPLPLPRKPLDLEERSNMQGRWATEHCPTCGYLHFGVCPRIARIVTERKGAQIVTVTTEYWPDGQWSLPEWHLSVADVFDDVPPATPTQGDQVDGS
jgi:hypothetical protein